MADITEDKQAPAWTVEQLRFTVFPTELNLLAQESWWQKITGEAPAKIEHITQQGVHTEEGVYQNIRLIIQQQVDRIHIIVVTDPFAPDALNFTVLLEKFRLIINEWTKVSPAILNRFAFGGILFHRVSSKVDGYNMLQHFLPSVTIDPVNSSDFSYAINRPRQKRISNIDVIFNRLNKWAVIRPVLLSMDSGKQELPFACRLELDINTAPSEDVQFGNESTLEAFECLVSEAIEIAEQGDIA